MPFGDGIMVTPDSAVTCPDPLKKSSLLTVRFKAIVDYSLHKDSNC